MKDTHDWRMWERGVTLVESQSGTEIRSLIDWSQLRKSDDWFAKKTYPRELSRRFTVCVQLHRYDVRNVDRKIVARLAIREFRLLSRRVPRCLVITVQAVRGYKRDSRRISRTLGGASLNETDLLSLLLANEADRPDSYPGHKSLGLVAGLPLPESAAELLLGLRISMEDAIPGIIDDTDTEFLHDFRVCLRKSRAFLTLVKSDLRSKSLKPHRRFLRSLGSATTRMRDLDVYALNADRFRNLLPPVLAHHLDDFFNWIDIQRIHELRLLTEYLQGDEFRVGNEAWKSFLTERVLFRKHAEPDSARFGREIITRTYLSLAGSARQIAADGNDTAIHQLRIDCKKLRYTIEFFKAPVGISAVRRVLRLLRNLQDVLGEFNDLSVQQQWLLDALQEPGTRHTRELDAAIGGLITSLFERQMSVRGTIAKRFEAFTEPGMVRAVETLGFE